MSENVKVKELPEMEDSDFKQCGNCIHLGKDVEMSKENIVCGAYRSYVDVAKELQTKFPYVKWENIMQDPAMKCQNFIPKIGMIMDKDLV